MLSLERQNEIVNYLKEHHSATVTELSEKFFIGPASIRRDLAKLEKLDIIQRTHGGAILVESLSHDIPLNIRGKLSYDAKLAIGRMAAEQVMDNDIIFMDSSTTTCQMAPYLNQKGNLTIVTNGLAAMNILGTQFHDRLFCCGGKIRTQSMSIAGEQALQSIRQYRAQKVFFSCRSITPSGLIDSSVEEAELRKSMIEGSDKVYFLCDSSKFDQQAFYQVCSLDKIHVLITEKRPSDQWMDILGRYHIQIIYGS